MTIKEAAGRLTRLGFVMNPEGTSDEFGTMKPEPFTHSKLHCLSVPFRWVFIGKTFKAGYYITSRITFTARSFRARKTNTFKAELHHIYGHGKTLEEAIKDFEKQFNLKVHGVTKGLTKE